MKCKTCSEIIPDHAAKETKGHCAECWDEIAFGIIRFSNSFSFGGSPHYTREDQSPGQENAIRAMEENQ